MSTRALIESAKRCAVPISQADCADCAFRGEGNGDCTGAILVALADRLEELETRWIDCKLARPTEEDEYLVMIAGAKKPTVLHYDSEEEDFYEEDCNGEVIWYPVTHWAMMPDGPSGGNPSTAYGGPPPFDKGGNIKRCATCAYEDKLGDEERCIECEKHNLWEERK